MMTSTTDSARPRSTSLDAGVAPLAAAGLIAAGAALATYLTRPTPRSGVADAKRRALVTYLRDHLSGSDVAINVVRRLASSDEGRQDGHMFRRLSEEFELERQVVRSLLTRLGASARSPKRAAGYASGLLVSLTAGGAPGELSRLRTLEALAIGIQGKRCLWRALQELSASSSGRQTFDELESMALRQWESVEERRRTLAALTFPALRQNHSRTE